MHTEVVAVSEERKAPHLALTGTSSATNYDTPGNMIKEEHCRAISANMAQNLQHVYNALDEMVGKEGQVILNPEFLMCDTTSHPESNLTFSSDGFEIKYLDLDSGQYGWIYLDNSPCRIQCGNQKFRYLSTRIEPTEKRRYHFFSSFFFRKLADLDKDQGRAPEGRAAFLGVRKWTCKTDIFAKDFLFMPVNFSLHWSLIVICYPGEVDKFEDGDAKTCCKLPYILHLDSLKGIHSGLNHIIRSYLWEEWKERHPESASDSSDKFLNLRFLSLELPQQDNVFDCGLFLLHYVELFLMDAPSSFNPLKIDVYSSFLSDEWFPPAEASLKRSFIQKLIHEMVTEVEPSQNCPKLVICNRQLDKRRQRSENSEGEQSREFLAQGCSAGESGSVCTIPGTQQQYTFTCLNDSEKGLPVSGCILETGGVSLFAVQEMRVSPPDNGGVVCLPSQDAEHEAPCAYSDNQLYPRSCASEDAEAFKGSCSVVKDKDAHEEPLLDSLDNNQKISSQAEVEVHEHDIMDSKFCLFSDNVDEVMACLGNTNEVEYDRSGASQDMDSVMTPDASIGETGPNPESTTGEAKDGRYKLSEDTASFVIGDVNKDVAERSFQTNPVEAMDGRCDLSEYTGSVAMGSINRDVAESFSERIIVEAEDTKPEDTLADPIGAKYDAKAEKTSTAADKINGSEKYVLSETSKDGNTDNVMTTGCTVFSKMNEGNANNGAAGGSTNGTGEGKTEVVPRQDDTTCTDPEFTHVNSVSTCSAENGKNSENTTDDAERPLPDSTCGAENILLVSDDKRLQEDVQYADAQFGRHYKRRKVYRRRRVYKRRRVLASEVDERHTGGYLG